MDSDVLPPRINKKGKVLWKLPDKLTHSRQLDVHAAGGEDAFLTLPRTHRGMSVMARRAAFSSLVARFLTRPHAQRAHSPHRGALASLSSYSSSSLSNVRIKLHGLSNGRMGGHPGGGAGECRRMASAHARRKDRLIRQMHLY